MNAMKGRRNVQSCALNCICQNCQLQPLHFSQSLCQNLQMKNGIVTPNRLGKIRRENSYRGYQQNLIFKKDIPTTAFVLPAYKFFWSRVTTTNRSPWLLDIRIRNLCKDMQKNEGMTDSTIRAKLFKQTHRRLSPGKSFLSVLEKL